MQKLFFSILCTLALTVWVQAQDDHGHAHGHDDAHHHAAGECGAAHDDHHAEFDATSTAIHHIGDANVYSIGPFSLPLPCMLYAPGYGWSCFMSSRFDIGHHGNGSKAVDRYVLDGGSVRRVKDGSFPMGEVEIQGFQHIEEADKFKAYVCYEGKLYETDAKSTADAGLFGGGITSYYDFSLTKNTVSLILVTVLLAWVFLSVAASYRKRRGMAPKGLQNFMETIFLFIQNEVVRPFLGHKGDRYQPFLMSLFFFILALNLFGQIPFLGGSNVTGNLAMTMALALLAFLVTNLSGNTNYWKHILWPPGIPIYVKVIMVPVEVISIFIKPLTLMLRLFANITAGHIVVVVFVSLIFIFGKAGENLGASLGAAVGSALLTLFMMAIELIVAFIQAFVFTILTASYIGAAVEEEHH